MARAHFLIPGFQYRIREGLLAEEIVTIVDNHPFPDSDPPDRRRKITVKFSDGNTDYILPRLLSDEPMGIDSPAIEGAPAQAVAQTMQEAWTTPEEAPIAPVHTTVVASSTDQVTVINPVTGLPITVSKVPSVPLDNPMDPRLDHLRPSREALKHYIPRTMMNGMLDSEMLLRYTNDFYRAKNEGHPASFMLKGETQGGKTLLIQVLAIKWADMLGLPKPMPIFTLSGSSGVTDYDLFGQPVTYTDPETGQDRLVHLPGVVALAAQCGGILYLDEINALTGNVTSSLHPLADHRHTFTNRGKAVLKGGVFMPEFVKAHPDLWILGTYNDGTYKGMGEMNEAFINRFRHIRWDYDENVEDQLITSPAIRLFGVGLRNARNANVKGFKTPVGTAALMRLEQDVSEMGVDMGLEIFMGMFKRSEYDTVKEILDVRIRLMMQEEANQAELNAIDAEKDLGTLLDERAGR
jgi:AAA domain (dynein-related subfamily)